MGKQVPNSYHNRVAYCISKKLYDVNLSLITNETRECKECSDFKMKRQILQSLGV